MVLVGLVASVAAASAQPAAAGTAMLWDAPAGCPDEPAVRARVSEQLGRPLGDRDQLAARVVVHGDATGFQADLSIEVGGRVVDRQVTGPDCEAVADAVALVLSMLVREAELPPPVADPIAPPAATVADAVVLQPGGPSPWSAAGRVGLLGEGGTLPGLGAGGIAALSIGWNDLRAEIQGSGWLARRAHIVEGSDAGADISLLAVSARGCMARGRRFACGLAELGSLEGRGIGLGDSRHASRRWSAAGAGAGIRFPLVDHVAAVVLLEGLLALDRPHFTLDDGTSIYQPAPVTLRLTLALETGTRP